MNAPGAVPSAPLGTRSSTVTRTRRAASAIGWSVPRPPLISTLPSSSARWAWSRKVSSSSGGTAAIGAAVTCGKRSGAGSAKPSVRPDPSGACRACHPSRSAAARKAVIRPSAVHSAASTVPDSSARRNRGASPNMSRLEKQNTSFLTAPADSSSSSPRLPPHPITVRSPVPRSHSAASCVIGARAKWKPL